ncbi:MAG: rhamnogalacturonan acetylesterase [Sphingomicrobium sp.]
MKKIVLVATALFAQSAVAAPSRIFIASDSTAQTYGADKYPQQGWGAMLPCAFDDQVTVENRAIGGRSTRSFINEGRLDKIAQDISADDTLLIQFGHNDQNPKPERYTSVADYKTNLRRYIDVAVQKGARPVLLTPVTQRKFVDGKVVASFPAYSGAVREVATQTRTPLIDLEQLSGRWVERTGQERSKALFLHYPGGVLPGFQAPVADDTHFSEWGARGVANIIAGELARLRLPVSSHVLAQRPALTVTAPLGHSRCKDETMPPMLFRVAGPKLAGGTDVAAGQAYDGRFGFEAGRADQFSVALPEGNYRVTLAFGDGRRPSETTVLAESRRLMIDRLKTSRGIVRRSFLVHLKHPKLAAPPENAPGKDSVGLKSREIGSLDWDDRLTLTFGGARPAVTSVRIEPVSAPAIFLMGDSTVTNQREGVLASWGQMLPIFVGPDAVVANHAESGETLKSFLAEGRLDKVLSRLRPGDYALIQFGHNDQKANWPQTFAAATSTYRAYLNAYIAEVRLRGATPILVTSPERAQMTADGKVRPTLKEYAEAVRAVAAEQKVSLVDLNAESIRLYEALGPERVLLLFGNPSDRTHHGPGGAYLLARAVAEGIRGTDLPLRDLLVPSVPAPAAADVANWDIFMKGKPAQ